MTNMQSSLQRHLQNNLSSCSFKNPKMEIVNYALRQFLQEGGRDKNKNKTTKKKTHVAIRIVKKKKRKECGIKGDTPLMEEGRE